MSAMAVWAPAGKRSALGERRSGFEDHDLAVPGEIRRALAGPGGGVDVGSEATGGGGLAEQAARLGAADSDGRAGEVGEDRGTGERRLGAGRDRHPHVLADLDMQHQPREVGSLEQQVASERNLLARKRDRAESRVAGGGLAALVELPVCRQIRLRNDAEQPAAMDHQRGIVDAPGMAQRRAGRPARGRVSRCPRGRCRRPSRRRRAARPAGAGPRSSSRTGRVRGTRRVRPPAGRNRRRWRAWSPHCAQGRRGRLGRCRRRRGRSRGRGGRGSMRSG